MIVRSALQADANEILEIYHHYVLTSHSTFELEPVGAAEMERRICACLDNQYPFLVAEADGKIAGYAYAHQYRPRRAYRQTVEVSVYIRPGYDGRGIGSLLYEQLIPKILDAGFYTVVAGIALPNEASVRLHEKFGFEKVAHFREVGRKFDRWIDVGYWQLSFRSDRS